MPETFSISNTLEDKTERWIGRILQICVWISGSLMTAGLFLGIFFPSTVFQFPENPTMANIAARLLSGSFDSTTLMFAGLVFLMFTPIFRVITAIAGFIAERDWRFVIVSCIVIALLAGEIVYSLFVK